MNCLALSGVKVLDLGMGMCGALAAKQFLDAGAEVRRLEPVSGDPFYEIYTAYRLWRRNVEIVPFSDDVLHEALKDADICIIGGEDYPDLLWRFDAIALAATNKRLVVLEFRADPDGFGDGFGKAIDLLVQARSGLTFEQSDDRAIAYAMQPATYGAVLQGVAGALGALYGRNRTGCGCVVSTSFLQGALAYCSVTWATADRPDMSFTAGVPKGIRQWAFLCADGKWLQISLGSPSALFNLYNILAVEGHNIAPDDRGIQKDGDPANFFGDLDLMQRYFLKQSSDDLLSALWAKGMPAERVLPPGGCWNDPQTIENNVLVTHGEVQFVGFPLNLKQGAELNSRAESPSGQRPLSGVRIVDMGAFVAGPYASALLGDLGADVIKVEPPGGDPVRPLWRTFVGSSRGKRSLCLDAKSRQGREILERLCASVDAVHFNFRAGVSKRLGLDFATLESIAPGIVVLESYAYGASGPKANNAGFDLLFQAFCGHEVRNGGEGGPPMWMRTPIIDLSCGMLGAIALLLSLLWRQREGKGVAASTSLLSSGVYLLSELVRTAAGVFEGARELNADQTGFHAAERLYQTKDGWIAVAARGEKMARALVSALERTDEISAPRSAWSDNEARILAAAFEKLSADSAIAVLRAHDVWADKCVKDPWPSFADEPSLRKVDAALWAHQNHLGLVKHIGPGFHIVGSPPLPESRLFTATLGQDTRAILRELGFDEAQVAVLEQEKIVFSPA